MGRKKGGSKGSGNSSSSSLLGGASSGRKSKYAKYVDENKVDLSMESLEKVSVDDLALLPLQPIVDLSMNAITSLPDSFGSLTHIVRLNLSSNRLETLPESFGSLESLKQLDLSKNQLTSLPYSFCDLRALQWLDLRDNKWRPDTFIPLDMAVAPTSDTSDKDRKECAKRIVAFVAVKQEAKRKEDEKKKRRKEKKELEKKEKEQRERQEQAMEKKILKAKLKAEAQRQHEDAARLRRQQQQEQQQQQQKEGGQNTVGGDLNSDSKSVITSKGSTFARVAFGALVLVAGLVGLLFLVASLHQVYDFGIVGSIVLDVLGMLSGAVTIY